MHEERRAVLLPPASRLLVTTGARDQFGAGRGDRMIAGGDRKLRLGTRARAGGAGVGALSIAGLLFGCGLFPSDPGPAPVAFRVEDRTVEMLIPDCGDGEEVASAAVYKYSAEPAESPVWTGSGHILSSRSNAVFFAESSWVTTEGSYADLGAAAFVVRTTTGGIYEGVLPPGSMQKASKLPSGEYSNGVARVTADEYEERAQDWCDVNVGSNS